MSSFGSFVRYACRKRSKSGWISKDAWMKKHGYGKYATPKPEKKRYED